MTPLVPLVTVTVASSFTAFVLFVAEGASLSWPKSVNVKVAVTVATAVSISGFSEKFIFYGFLPEKKQAIAKVFDQLSKFNYTCVFFVSSKKVNKIIPEKKDIVIIIPAVPGTAMFVNFIYNAYKIKQIENNKEIIPRIIPR